ncbi:hypothetical protein [Noviherbaspirillum pedocola]|uniref:Uncharacterized protein n=1 Tax=Noviherbaspirillum pedocola TaxID=2801341 RepID=A0A934W9B8_9BURK|nr:hypothetical protein [Noviherbaspirillum pedocola]MBK4737893.1 hypothetical protein [Noviherbaspirillum pedocola]
MKRAEIILVKLTNGDAALFVNADAVLSSETSEKGTDPAKVAPYLAKALGVEFQTLELAAPAEPEDWSWNDVYALIPDSYKATEAVQVFQGYFGYEGTQLNVEFQAPVGATVAEKDAAFMAALAQQADIDYHAVGESSQALVAGKAGAECARCGSHMEGDYCSDEICPYSEWPQRVPLQELEAERADGLRKRYGVLPRVRVYAEVHDDSHFKKEEFDAAPWFAQATEEQIINLHGIGWKGDEPSDVVAEFFEKSNRGIADLFAFCRATHTTRNHVGFECSVDEDSAMDWLKLHRPGLWAQLV